MRYMTTIMVPVSKMQMIDEIEEGFDIALKNFYLYADLVYNQDEKKNIL